MATASFTGVFAGENLVENGNFNQGDGASSIVGWQEQTFAGGGSVKHVLDGKGAPYVTLTSDENNGEGSDFRIYQTIHGEFNTTYKVKGKIRAEGVKNKNNTGAIISIPYEIEATDSLYNTHGKWKRVTMFIQTTDSKKDFDISLSVGGHSSQNYGTASFKDISVEKFDGAVPGNATVCKFKNTGKSDQSSGGSTGTQSSGSKSNVWLIVIAIVIVCAIGIYFLLFTGKKPDNGGSEDSNDDDTGDDDTDGINDINDPDDGYDEDSVDDTENEASESDNGSTVSLDS